MKRARLKAALTDSLQKFEKEASIRFANKPLDLKKLHLVAFVQDQDSKEILQAAAIPITGEVATAEEPEPPASKKEKPTENP